MARIPNEFVNGFIYTKRVKGYEMIALANHMHANEVFAMMDRKDSTYLSWKGSEKNQITEGVVMKLLNHEPFCNYKFDDLWDDVPDYIVQIIVEQYKAGAELLTEYDETMVANGTARGYDADEADAEDVDIIKVPSNDDNVAEKVANLLEAIAGKVRAV